MRNTREDWAKYCDGNRTAEDIARHFNVKESTVYSMCRKLGLPIKKTKLTGYLNTYSKEEVSEYAKEHTTFEIAEHFNVSMPKLRKYLHTYNIDFVHMRMKKDGFDGVTTNQRKSGLARDMIKVLGPHFSYASIARVFGFSQEYVSDICKGK